MLLSMTGFGKATLELPTKKLTIEVKSLNSKQLDLSTRMPNLYREKDLEVRTQIAQKLFRGKVDFLMFAESTTPDRSTILNQEIIVGYCNQLQQISDAAGLGNANLLGIAMTLPDVTKTEQPELTDDEWQMVSSAIDRALDAMIDFRTQEGRSLEADFRQRIGLISQYLDEVPKYEQERIDKIRTRIESNLNAIIAKENIDQNRLEQELIFYIEKLDINEEKVRLRNHINYFIETMEKEPQAGRKLGFIAQEMGREINTLGSKANQAELQRLVIKMKDELEKIKEQVLNVL